jgi:hypothetical protein
MHPRATHLGQPVFNDLICELLSPLDKLLKLGKLFSQHLPFGTPERQEVSSA